jgi:hypothetical protein
VVSKRNNFPKHIRDILWRVPILTATQSLPLKVVDFTDKMYISKLVNEQRQLDTRVNAEVSKLDIPIRPSDTLDTLLASLRIQLAEKEAELERLMKAPTKKYITPSMRKQVALSDPAVQSMQTQIEKTKNEISIYEKYIADANNDWKRLKHFELRHQVIQEMFTV